MIQQTYYCKICRTKAKIHNFIKVGSKYTYHRCANCKSGTLVPFPTQTELNKYYQTQNYYVGLSKNVSNSIVQWLFTRKLFKSYDKWVQSYYKKPGTILDVGTGNGEFLCSMKEANWKVWGSDISKLAANNTNLVVGQKRVLVGRFGTQKWNEKFNAITFWHILEHEENPLEYFNKAYSLLKNEAKIFGEVPNFDSPWLWLFAERYAWIMIPVHVVYFSPQSLKYLLESSGFRSIEVYTPPRALLNLSLSVSRKPIIVGVLAPLSILIGLVCSWFRKGEVIRFTAIK